MRNYSGKQKWVSGVIIKIIGGKMYQINSNDKKVIRHIDQILLVPSHKMESNGSQDWYDVVDTNRSNEAPPERRYPLRQRNPVARYGVDPD